MKNVDKMSERELRSEVVVLRSRNNVMSGMIGEAIELIGSNHEGKLKMHLEIALIGLGDDK